MLSDSTEGDRVPVGLRGFGRHPGQRGQREADVPVGSAVPPAPEPAGTAAPHRHPGEPQVTQVIFTDHSEPLIRFYYFQTQTC